MPSALQKRSTAWVVLILCALLALFGMGGVKLRAAYKVVANQYEQRVDPEFAARAEAAQNILKLADKLNESNTEELENALDSFDAAEGPARSTADLEVEKAVNDLSESLKEKAQNANKRELLSHQLAEFESRGRIAQYELEEYNQNAEKFNQKLKSFPASVIRLVWNIEKLEYCV